MFPIVHLSCPFERLFSVLLTVCMFSYLIRVSSEVTPAYRAKLGLSRYRFSNGIPLKTNKFMVSGHSSGATAATHFYLSYSANVEGLALFASLHYLCGEGSLVKIYPCLRGWGNVSEAIRWAEILDGEELIDPLEHMWNKRHYVYHGTNDPVIHFDSGVKVYQFFDRFSPNVRFQWSNSAHSLPSKTCGIACNGIPSNPGVGCSKCDFSAAFEGLNYLYENQLHEPTVTNCRPSYDRSGLWFVDQSAFLIPMAKSSMLPDGILYIPAQCRVNSTLCTLHVAFHGCRHSIQNDGMDYIKCSGYLEIADANSFIVLFPQVMQSPLDFITLFHCWDLYGYSGPLFGTKFGSQTQVVARLISGILGTDVDVASESYR